MKTTTHLQYLLISALFSMCAIMLSVESSAQCPSCNGGSAPSIDACTGALDLGLLNTPLACPLGTGTPRTFNGSNICATAEFPYGYITGCQTGGDMALAADVWYRFQITGNVLNVQIASALRGVSLGLWQDPGTGCDNLVARNCAETTSGGNLSTTFTALNPGIYYLQVSGTDTLDQCDFTLTLTNNEDCTACIQQNNLTVSPLPVNGTYLPGTAVTFNYTISDYNQTATNWIHGIVPHFGNGWDLSTLTGQIPPASCDVNGTWGWYNQIITGSFRGISDGPGFFFESTLGCPSTCDPNNPGDNYGDQGVSVTCPLTFQWTITTLASCPPGQSGDDLNVEIFNYGDSETGSWTSPGCETDPNYRFFAQLFCCDGSAEIIITGSVTNVNCNGGSDGKIDISVLGGTPPFSYQWDDPGNQTTPSATGLPAGSFNVIVTDSAACTTAQNFIVSEPLAFVGVMSVVNVTCSSGTGTAVLQLSGGTVPYHYSWTTGDTTATIIAPVGTYHVSVTDAHQCVFTDSVVIARGTFINAQICEGDSFFAGGAFQTVTGTYYDTLLTSEGCDSILVWVLYVLPNSFNMQVSICEGDSFFAGGNFQTETGTYFDTLSSSMGCDSIVITELIVIPASFGNTQVSICTGDSYFVGGADQTQAGFYTDTLTDSNGCDSILTTELIVIPPSQGSVQVSICEGDSYFVGGADQTEAGFYIDTLFYGASNGCDSILTTELIVLPNSFTNVQASICEGESYFAGWDFQTESGTYYGTLQNYFGCDSIVITELIVLPNSFTNVDASICEGESYFAGGDFQTETGSYYDTLTAANGCDSVVITNLTVGDQIQINFYVNEISCTCDSSGSQCEFCPPVNCCDGNATANATGGFPPYQFSWSTGATSNYSGDSLCVGTYYLTITDALGCSTTDSVSLVRADITTASAQICEGDSILLGGAYQTEPGFYYDTLGVTDGCFEILKTQLIVLPNSFTNVDASVCEGESYFAGGDFQTDSGTYYDTFTANNGCDSIVITELIVLPNSFDTQAAFICEGDSFFAGGDFQTESGIYYDTFTANNGCDSIVITELTVQPGAFTNLQVSICEGDSYYAGWDFQTETGTYYDTLSTTAGCDSVVITELTVLPSSFTNVGASICEGESYFAGGNFQTESGTYYDTLIASNGCDSIVLTELTVNPTMQTDIEALICEGDSIYVGGAYISEEGTYYDTLQTSQGCDSILVWDLFVLPSSLENVQAMICSGEGYFAGGDFQTETGIYFDTLTNTVGCDSIVITELIVIPTSLGNVQVSICEGESYFVGGDFQSQAGFYTDTLTGSNGCDSILTTELIVLPNSFSNVQATICSGESYFAGGDFQRESGTYYDTLTSAIGCDSIVTTELIVRCDDGNACTADACSNGVCVFTLIQCNGNVVEVNQNVTVNFNTSPPAYTGDPDLLPYFTYDNSGPAANTWKAIFNLGSNKLVVKNGATITVTNVPNSGNNQYAPGIVINSKCEVEVENGGHIVVNSLNRNAGDIYIQAGGNILINGEIRNQVSGTNGLPGAITVISAGGDLMVGSTGLVQILGVDAGGNLITLNACGNDGDGDIVISGLVKSFAAAHAGDLTLNRPNIKVVTLNGRVTVNANTTEPLYDEFLSGGTRYDIWGGLLSWVSANVNPGKVEVQAKGDITVNGHGTDPTTPVRESFGAIAAIATASNAPGGLVEVISLEGKIVGNNRAFDVSGRNRLSTNFANIRLSSKLDISLNRLGSNNNFNPVVDASSPSVGDKGGKNTLRSFSGNIIVGTNAQVSAAVPAGSGTVQGVNLMTSCLGVTNNGTITPADLNAGDNIGTCSPASPGALFTGCPLTCDSTGAKMEEGELNTSGGNDINLTAYPNPFSDQLTFEFSVPGDSQVSLELYNISGERIATVFEGKVAAGEINKQVFHAGELASGLYMYRMKTNETVVTERVMLVR